MENEVQAIHTYWDNKLTKGEDGHHWHRDQEALTINGEFDPIQHLETVR